MDLKGLKKKIEESEKRFDEFNKKKEELQNQLNEIQNEQIRLQGEYRVLTDLEKENSGEVPESENPKK